ANRRGAVCGVPDVAHGIRNKTVRAVALGKIELSKLTRRHVDASELVRCLAGVPQRVAGTGCRIVRKRVRRQDGPVVKCDLRPVWRLALPIERNGDDGCQHECPKDERTHSPSCQRCCAVLNFFRTGWHGQALSSVWAVLDRYDEGGGSIPIALFRLSYGTARVLCVGAILSTLRFSCVTFLYRSIPYSGVRDGSLGSSPAGGLYPSP